MLNPDKKYNLEYYLGVVDKIVAMGAHIVGVKDRMLTPIYSGRSLTNYFYSGWCPQAACCYPPDRCYQEEVP
jgi:hypothetical protein